MKKFVIFLVVTVVFLTVAKPGVSQVKKIRELKQPTFSQPAFALPGGTISLKMDVPSNGVTNGITLKNTENGAPAIVVPLESELQAGMNKIRLSLPENLKPGLYDLCVEIILEVDIEDCQPHSVAVLESFEPPFRFAQVSDYHVGDPRSQKQFPGVDIEKVRVAALEAVNGENPAFVFFTGDTTAYPETYDVDYPAAFGEILETLKVPAIFVPGNHDLYSLSDDEGKIVIDGLSYWEEYFGPVHRFLDFGPFRFIAFNSYGWGTETRNKNRPYHLKAGTSHTYQGALARDEYRWIIKAIKNAGDRTPILVGHHSPRQFELMPQQWCRECITPTKFRASMNKYKVPLYIFGHIHRNEEFEDKGTRYIATTSVGSDVEKKDLWMVRIFDVQPDLSIETKLIKLFDSPPMKN